MAIIGAEMIASNEGVGYLIWNSRLFFRTDWIFVGLISLGFMGFSQIDCSIGLVAVCCIVMASSAGSSEADIVRNERGVSGACLRAGREKIWPGFGSFT